MRDAFVLLGSALALIACEPNPSTDTAPENSCSQDAVRTCSGENGCTGERHCAGDPGRWGSCQCSDDPPARPPADAAVKAELGADCAQDDDCPAHAFCLGAASEELFGGGPPEGTCVARCDDSPAACERFADAVCVPVADAHALCFERCTLGPSDQLKCHERHHVACAPLEDAADGAFCRPLCASDDDCSQGLCDPVQGVCVADAILDPTFGLRCDPISDASSEPVLDGGTDAGASAALSSCAGPCVQLNDAPSLCSRRCVFGEAGECAPASGGLRRGACVFVAPGGSIADLGYCGELCDCSADCSEPTFICDAFDDDALQAAFGRKGVCTDPALVLSRELVCEK